MPTILIYNADIGWVDMSSWIVSCQDVHIISRNRDWSPITNGIKISISNKAIANSLPFTPVKGAEVLIRWEGDDHFLGYIKHFTFDYGNYTWELEVNHFLMKLEDYRIRLADLNEDLLQGVVDWGTDGKTFTVDTVNDMLVCSGHGLSDGDRVLITSDGTLPDELEENHFYWVTSGNTGDATKFYVYKDFANYSKLDIGGGSNIGHITFAGAGTGNHSFVKNTNLDLYNDCAFYRDIKVTGCDATGDQILCDAPYNTIPAEGDYHGTYGAPGGGDQTYFTLVVFHGADLPNPLAENRAYIAAKFPENTGFVLYQNISEYEANTRINLNDAGSGEMWFQFIMRFGTFNQTIGDYENVSYNTPFVQLRYLIKKIFEKIGITLNSTAIEDIVYHRHVYTEWTWEEVYLLTTMLYNINQQAPLKPSLVDSRYLDSQITLLQFIQDIFGKLGIGLKYAGDYEYTLISQKRDVNSLITPDAEDYFVIPDDNKLGLKQETLEASGGWMHSRFLAPPNAWAYRYDDQDIRSGNVAGDLTDAHYSGDTGEYQNSRFGAGINDIEWFNHLFLFLINKSGGNNYVEDNPQLSYELYDFPNAGDLYSIIQNQKNTCIKDYTVQEIECRALYLSQAIWSAKEVSLDIAKRRIKITQERTTT